MVGVGVIGYGYWGPNVARNLASLDGCDLRVICDADPLALDKITRLYPGCRTTTDCDEVFAAPDVDAVAICTPVHTHFPLARAALEAGLHVLVEKPLTNSLDSARALTELARKRNRVLQVDHTFVYSGAVQTIRSMIDAGELGDLLYVDSVRINLGLFQSDVSVIWDLAAHDVSIISSLIHDRPEWVSAVGSSHYGRFENLAYVTMMYPGSLLAHAHVNWLAPVKLRSTLFGGSKRMVVYDDLSPSEPVRVYDKGVSLSDARTSRERALVDYRLGSMFAPHIEKSEPLNSVCADFVRCIEAGEAPLADGAAGVDVVQILEAAEQSILKNGERIFLSRD